jgi:hypothetical protein
MWGFKIIDSINKKFNLTKQKPKFKGLLTTGTIEEQKNLCNKTVNVHE